MSPHGWPAGALITARITVRITVRILAPLLVTAIACRPETTCAEDGTPCGGDPTGAWSVIDACRDPVFAAPMPMTYQGQPVAMARQPNPVAASSDWCSSIFLGGAATTAFTFPHDTLSVSGGQLTYQSDGTYEAVIDTAGSGAVDLSPTCLARSGTGVDCGVVTSALVAVAAVKPAKPGGPCSDSPAEPSSCQFYYSYRDIGCVDNAAGGCRCTYDVSFAGTVNGRWSTNGGLLTHFDTSKMLPSQVDYCVDAPAGLMALWGHDRTSVLEQDGIRTLKLQRMP